MIGMATYGRSFTLASTSQNGIGAPASGPGAQGEFTRSGGFLAYYEVGTNKCCLMYTTVKHVLTHLWGKNT